MKTFSAQPSLPKLRAICGPLLVAATCGLAMPASALTDLSSTPLQGTAAAEVKPNIMLLMDASRSLGWGHMPDEVETVTKYGSVGYKNAQCNVLYYSPSQRYVMPKKADGSSFAPLPLGLPFGFTNALYTGFISYYAAPDALDSSVVDLSSAFKAYDSKMLYQTFHNDTPQPAYYYTYSGGTALSPPTPTTPIYKLAACADPDTGVTHAFLGSGGGTWTKVIVSSNSGPGATDERLNFAIWYSFYRTRMNLTKSAASLAFTPLTDSFRVGFITVEPKAAPTDAAIDPSRYVEIKDFDIPQRGLWFGKLFSQSPFGASPAREGLARVGRHYAGKHDLINTGMTGDPMQYSCQQNFTIMTTDGYWNAQTETPTTGTTYGGPLQIDGMTRVGQQDGDTPCPVTDPYCPRPIYDGYGGSKRVDTDVATLYADQSCGLTLLYRSTFQNYETHHQVQKTTTVTTQVTDYFHEVGAQDVAQTFQMIKTVTQMWKQTSQLVENYVLTVEDRYQVKKSQDQTTLHTEVWKTQKIQTTAQTTQTTETKNKYTQASSQYRSTTVQFNSATTQYAQKVEQYTQGKVQIIKHVYQTIATDSSLERQDALPGACVTAGTITCSTFEIFGPAAVDPTSCTAGVGPAPDNIKTDCTSGGMAVPTAPVAFCTTAGSPTNSGTPNYVVTTCTLSTITAQAPISLCTVGSVTGASPSYYVTTCLKPVGVNNQSGAVPSCTVGTLAGTFPSWITTVCSNPVGSNNLATFVNSCVVGTVPGTSPGWVSTACDTSSASNFAATLGPVCVPGTAAGVSPSWITVVCTKIPVSAIPKAPASCAVSGPTSGNGWIDTTCPSANVAPFAATTPVDTTHDCTSGNGVFVGGGSGFIVTTCANGPATQAATASAPCTLGPTPGTSPGWTKIVCTKPTDTTAFSPPCISAGPTGPGFVKTTCTLNPAIMLPTVVDPTTCPLGTTTGATPAFIVTHCLKSGLPLLGGLCVAGNTGFPFWIQRDCNSFPGPPLPRPAGFCIPGVVRTVGSSTYTCAANNTAAYAPSCMNVPGTVSPYIAVVCTGPTVVGSMTGPVDPSACTNGTGAGPSYYITTCGAKTAAGPYAVPTGVSSCVSGYNTGTGGANYETQCTNPVLTNFNRNTPSCAVVSVPKGGGNSYTSYDCTHITTSTTAPGPAPTYCAQQTSNGATAPPWVAITCTTAPGAFTNTAVDPATCTTAPDTACVTTAESGSTFVGTCPASPGPTPNFYVYTCGSTPSSAPVADPGCVTSTGPGPAFLQTSCSSGPGIGHKEVQTISTTVTTNIFSGALLLSTTATTTPGPTTDVGVCGATPVILPSPNPLTVPTVSVTTALPGGSIDSLADVAQYYYKTDLRPTMLDNVPTIDATPEGDHAAHQHMTTFTLALGVSGTVPYSPTYKSDATGAFADIRAGVRDWPLWPDPAIDYTSTPAMAANWENPKAIDDFWHTAVNGRGTFFSATNPRSVIDGLGAALAGISATLASSTGQGVSSQQPVAGNNFIYTATYKTSRWTGDIIGSTINLSNGAVDTPPLWSAQALLVGKTKAQCDNRFIYLARAGAVNGMVPFTWNTDTCVSGLPSGLLATQLNGAEQGYFNSTAVSLLSQFPEMTDGTSATVDQRSAAVGDKLVNFVRGQRGYEGFVPNQLATLYRQRDYVLGDIVNSQPVYVRVPFASYTDTGYDTFKATNALRTPMVYVGANDGMLHAFYAGVDATDLQKGQEAWAIIPSSVLPNLYKLAAVNYANVHQFYVDGTPTVGDVYDTSGIPSWKTVLVEGLNDGGKAYFAVDVTDPASPKTLWEFKWDPAVCPATAAAAVGNTADCHLGYTYGKPVITKLADGRWVALVTSGYNNVNSPVLGGDGVGYLYVLNVMTGAIIAKISTGAGASTAPSGLAQINNYVDNVVVNNTTLRVYGGDLLGNIWRFDINGTPSATLLGTATDTATANPQPITTRPELAEIDNKPVVLVGTGSLLGATDIAVTQGQSIYGFTDPLTAGPVYPSLRASLKPMVMTLIGGPPITASSTRTVACDPFATVAQCASPAGWVVDLLEPGERVNVDMKLVLGTLIAASNVPEDTACSSGGHSWINYLNFSTGLSVTNAPGSIVSQYLANSLVVGLGIIALPPLAGFSNPRYVGEVMFGNGSGVPIYPIILTPPPVGKRVSWREIAK